LCFHLVHTKILHGRSFNVKSQRFFGWKIRRFPYMTSYVWFHWKPNSANCLNRFFGTQCWFRHEMRNKKFFRSIYSWRWAKKIFFYPADTFSHSVSDSVYYFSLCLMRSRRFLVLNLSSMIMMIYPVTFNTFLWYWLDTTDCLFN